MAQSFCEFPKRLKRFPIFFCSDEAKAIQSIGPEIGIDVLGSGFGALLLMRAQIPYRLGVRGYAGGTLPLNPRGIST